MAWQGESTFQETGERVRNIDNDQQNMGTLIPFLDHSFK